IQKAPPLRVKEVIPLRALDNERILRHPLRHRCERVPDMTLIRFDQPACALGSRHAGLFTHLSAKGKSSAPTQTLGADQLRRMHAPLGRGGPRARSTWNASW